jgi:hypothetical protein
MSETLFLCKLCTCELPNDDNETWQHLHEYHFDDFTAALSVLLQLYERPKREVE